MSQVDGRVGKDGRSRGRVEYTGAGRRHSRGELCSASAGSESPGQHRQIAESELTEQPLLSVYTMHFYLYFFYVLLCIFIFFQFLHFFFNFFNF